MGKMQSNIINPVGHTHTSHSNLHTLFLFTSEMEMNDLLTMTSLYYDWRVVVFSLLVVFLVNIALYAAPSVEEKAEAETDDETATKKAIDELRAMLEQVRNEKQELAVRVKEVKEELELMVQKDEIEELKA
mmetsp:Transcript_32192/g.54930  ORF Transcript_32192/g.54930 Transcript_32192/m.54930 type:complete len:131 (-) Transcript_32192:442-834(-)